MVSKINRIAEKGGTQKCSKQSRSHEFPRTPTSTEPKGHMQSAEKNTPFVVQGEQAHWIQSNKQKCKINDRLARKSLFPEATATQLTGSNLSARSLPSMYPVI